MTDTIGPDVPRIFDCPRCPKAIAMTVRVIAYDVGRDGESGLDIELVTDGVHRCSRSLIG